jgi:molybdopterin biosynthesis enzyme
VVATYHLYVRRLVARLMGCPTAIRSAEGVLQADMAVSGTRFCLVGARLEHNGGDLLVHPATRQRSGRLSSLRGLNGFVMLDENSRKLRAGDVVRVEWID